MRKYIIVIFTFIFLIANPHESLDIEFLKNLKQSKKETLSAKHALPPSKPKSNLPAFEEVIQNCEKIDGLFTFYWNRDDNKIFMEINEDNFSTTYLFNMTRNSGDGYYYDSGNMLWEYPFTFEKKTDKIYLILLNTFFRADQAMPINKAIQDNFSNSIGGLSKIVSSPNEKGAILIDANTMFLQDIAYVSESQRGKYKFDKSNSYITELQSFPNNSEIEIYAHFASSKWTDSYTLQNSHSMYHSYHISMSAIEENNYTPRLSDDRVGYFTTIFQDYSDAMKESPYVRYINRWNLKKKDPSKELSEPVQPIVFWLENTIPHEYREAVKTGVLAWNEAFENIGFKNAIVVKQMPDNADWNPGDVRYSTIRWFIQPGSGYAVGPSRANPYTGEIYDADIRISADFVRAFYREYDKFIIPTIGSDDPVAFWEEENKKHDFHKCNYSEHLSDQMVLGWHALNTIQNSNNLPNLEEYVFQGLVDLVLHEVGHTLGLRHNFKASAIYSVDELSNPNFTSENGISGSVMDYHPVSLLDKGTTMFQTKPGPYDMWAIEYGYSELPLQDEAILLNKIAEQSTNPLLQYGTDEDAYGLSSRGIDPLCNSWDMSSDPIEYYSRQLDLVDTLWDNLLDNFEKDGYRYQKIRSVFSQGMSDYYSASRTASKFIGGIHYSRQHIGDPNAFTPLIVADVKKQRQALDFLNSRIFSCSSFDFEPELLNKLAPERTDDFTGYVWRMNRLDYPIHDVIKRVHSVALYSIFHPRRISRIQDNELRQLTADIFTLEELFISISSAIWLELDQSKNINSYRRELQNLHIDLFQIIILDDEGYPHDAQIVARQSLEQILSKIYFSLTQPSLDSYTIAHLQNSAQKIENILEAQININ